MGTTAAETIKGEDIFFDFIEVQAEKLPDSGDLVKKLKTGEIHGFVCRNLFTKSQIADILKALERAFSDEAMITPSGKTFPRPFAVVTDDNENLNAYYDSIAVLRELTETSPALQLLRDRMDYFFKAVGKNYKVSIPINKVKGLPVCAGHFRIFYKDKGGLYVHCGNLFQQQSQYYYSLLANDIDMDDQLSFFLNLQNSETGGELTIYDMLWKDVVGKKTFDENDSVIDKNGNTIYLKDVKQFTVKPTPGDVLVFSGGPIWHRVEDIKGETPRITFGGFLNFSKNNEELFYWS